MPGGFRTRKGADCELLRQIEGGTGEQKGDPCSLPRRRHSEEAYYRWRKEYGGLKQG